MDFSKKLMYIVIIFLSCAIITLEVSLTRILNFIFKYHLSFLVISVALCGIGISGIVLFIFYEKLSKSINIGLIGFVTSVFLLLIFITSKINIDDILLLYYFIASIPFFFGGLSIALYFAKFKEKINKLYFANLIGSGLGAFVTIFGLENLGAIKTILLCVILVSICLLMLALEKKHWLLITLSVVLLLGVMLALNKNYDYDRLLPTYFKYYPEIPVVYTAWNSFSRIDVLKYNENSFHIVIDGEAGTPIIKYDKDLNLENFLKKNYYYNIPIFPYIISNASKSLIIGAGGGGDVVCALTAGVKNITAVEVNPIIVDIVLNKFANYTGYSFTQPQVSLILEEGRTFLKRSNEKFDVIQLVLVDTWSPIPGGAYTLTESFLYTKEAFKDYINHLTDNGILCVSWWDHPPHHPESLKLYLTASEVLKDFGDNPENKVVILTSNETEENLALFMLKKTNFSKNEVEYITKKANEYNLPLIYTLLNGTYFLELVNETKFNYPFDVRPATDDRPFFFWFGEIPKSFVNIVYICFIILFISILLIFYFSRKLIGDNKKISILISYFCFIGLGYIFVEVLLLQKFIQFLGNPIYAMAVILPSFLIFSSIGSFFSNRIIKKHEAMGVFLCIALIIIFYSFALQWIFNNFITLNVLFRVLITIALIFPIAFLIGIPFPFGIKIFNIYHEKIIPAFYGIDSLVSVLGSMIINMRALYYGFKPSFYIAAIIYFIGAIIVLRLLNEK